MGISGKKNPHSLNNGMNIYYDTYEVKLTNMKRPKRRIQITEYDFFTLYQYEKDVYQAILKETILNNKPCAQLSLSDLSKTTGLHRNTVAYQLRKLEKRRLIKVDKTQKTNTIYIVTTYKEIIR